MHTPVTLIASYLIFVCLLCAGYVVFRLPRSAQKQFLAEAIIGGILTLGLAKIGSKLYYDPRPFVTGHFIPYFSHARDNGFPSDHTLLTAFLGFLVLRYRKAWGAALLAAALLIGVCRVIAGVHHVVDILGSFAFAGVGTLLAVYFCKIIHRHSTPLAKS